MKLYNGDCLEEMKKLPDNSVDSIVTDPPYGLKFMGKKWDYEIPSVEIWQEAIRVLKPGGHLLSFGGSRTYHRMAVAIEDAGFEIRDQIMWVYGCLSEDTEVLTSNGWERYHKDTKYGKIMVYDIQKDIYKWEEPEGWQSYQINKDTAYRIQSDYTDQIVSRNHRCLVEREGKLTFVQAEELSEMELMPTLSNDFYRVHKLQSKVLLLSVFGQVKGLAQELFSKWQGKEKTRERAIGCGQSCVERGGNLFQEKGKLRKIQNKVFALSERILSYGKERQLCYGTQAYNGTSLQSPSYTNGSCPPHQSQPRGQSLGEPDVVSVKQGSQDTRMARVTKIEYSGIIFCPTVSTGAFVARRNGKIFITGNSGFPKSHNISIAIDKQTGGMEHRGRATAHASTHHPDGTKHDSGKAVEKHESITQEAKKYEGWGTALKPAHEPICMARKPLSEKTVALNVIKWGCGGINIDGCRVGFDKEKENFGKEVRDYGDKAGGQWQQGKQERSVPPSQGRFPANFIHDGSDEVVGLFPETKTHSMGNKPTAKSTGMFGVGIVSDNMWRKNDSGSASRFFKTCPYEEGEGASFTYQAKASKKERYVYLTCNCQTVKLESWPKQDQNLNEQTDGTSPEADTYEEQSEVDLFSNTSISGKKKMEKSLSDTHSITSTTSKQTTDSAISSSSMLLNTNESTEGVNLETENGGSPAQSVGNSSKLQPTTGISPQKDGHCMGVVVPATSAGWYRKSVCVDCGSEVRHNGHPTQKPTSLMQYLVRLVTPVGGTVLDPFMGSGSTGKACVLEGFDFVGIELDPEYCKIAKARIENIEDVEKES